MKKYDIDKCFKKSEKFVLPLNKWVVPLVQKGEKDMHKCLLNRNDIIMHTEEIPVENDNIMVHVLLPKHRKEKNPCLFYMHGGGFIYDASLHHYENAVKYAKETNSIVVLPRYRLLPKVTHPIPLNDCKAVYKWMLTYAEEYQIDREQIGIGGDSAGGFLTAKLTNWAVSRGDKILYQLLIYPVIDSDMRTASMKRFDDTPMWNSKLNRIMWKWYYPDIIQREISLLDSTLPDKLPNTYIETAEYDCLHDEGILYAKKLRAADVKTFLYETRGTIHGYDGMHCEISRNAFENRVKFIKKCVEAS